MGMLDSALKMVLGSGGGPVKKILGSVVGMVGAGGLSKVLSAFTDKGMGDKVQSWVGTGDNQEITADEVKRAMPAEELQRIADEAGCSVDEAAQIVAQQLPEVVNQATPDGQVPADADLDARVEAMRQELG